MLFSPNRETQLDLNNLSTNIASVNIERKGCCTFLDLDRFTGNRGMSMIARTKMMDLWKPCGYVHLYLNGVL
jgi:hypothetical protein